MEATINTSQEVEAEVNHSRFKNVIRGIAKVVAYWMIEALLILIAAAAVVYYYYDKQPTYSAADARTCVVVAGDHIITGERMYFYDYKELFGWRLIDVDSIENSTMYNVEGYAVTVVGFKDRDNWFSNQHELGESGYKPLDVADSYTFIVNGVPAVTTYEDFCE